MHNDLGTINIIDELVPCAASWATPSHQAAVILWASCVYSDSLLYHDFCITSSLSRVVYSEFFIMIGVEQ